MAQMSVASPDCGAYANHAAIAKTETLIIKQVQPQFVSESLRDSKNACVRMVFSITKSGRASKIKIVETSGERALDHAAVEALKHYQFKVPSSNSERVFMLVIRPSND